MRSRDKARLKVISKLNQQFISFTDKAVKANGVGSYEVVFVEQFRMVSVAKDL